MKIDQSVSSIFDPPTIAELRTILGESGTASLQRAFVEELRRCPAVMARQFAENDCAAGRASAHYLKGAAQVVGALAVARAAHRVENDPVADIPDALAEMAAAVRAVTSEQRTWGEI